MNTAAIAKQLSLSQTGYGAQKKLTRRDLFLAKIGSVVPWNRLIAVTEPHYPKSRKRGRPPIDIGHMLLMYFIPQRCGQTDVAVEDAIYDNRALRNFCFPKD